jgi:hypothetical protein
MNTLRIFTVIFFLIVGQFIFLEHCHAYPYHNLALLQSVGASSSAPNHPPAFAVDGNDGTFWKPAEDDDDPWIEVFLGSEYEIDHVVLPLFTGLEAYEIDHVVHTGLGALRIEVLVGPAWREVYNGHTHEQVLFGFQPVNTRAVRLLFDGSGMVSLNEIQVYAHNPQPVFVNQSGYNLHGPKRFTAPKAAEGSAFGIKRVSDGKMLYRGYVFNRIGDFSDFTPADPGPYIVEVQSDEKAGSSMPFDIGPYWIQKVSYQKAVDFMLDSRCWWGDARDYAPTDSQTFCTRGVAWRDGVQYSFEVSSLVMLYLSNPGAFTVERMPVQGPYQGLRHSLPEDTPEIVRLIYWGVDIYLRAKVDDAMLKEQLAYFVYAYPHFSEYIPRGVYEEALAHLLKTWGEPEIDRFENIDFGMSEFYSASYSGDLFSTYEKIGTGKGHFPPGHSIVPNLMMYEVAKREKLPEMERFFQAAYDQTAWIIRNLDWSDPKVTKGQRQGEFVTVTSLSYFQQQYPERAPEGLRDKIRSWADVMIAMSYNMWDFRKYSEDRWVIPNIRPPDHPFHAFDTGFNEPGNVAGLPAPLLAAAAECNDALMANRLRQLAFSHIDNVFGRNPTGRHFCYDGVADFEGVDLGWFKEFQGGAGQLQSARGVLDGSPKETTYPFDPYAGDPGHSEGWVTFNTPWNITLAFLSSHETNLEVFDRSFIKPIQTITLGNEDRQIGIRLQAPLNFDYSKIESGEVMIKTSRGDSYRMTVYEKTPNDMAFTGLINFEEGRVDPGDDLLQVRPGDTITVSYGYDFFKKSVTIEVIK